MATPESIPALLADMKKDQKELRELIHELMWHMRGSLSREEAWTLSPVERSELLADIKKRIETVEKTQLPLL